ncbi:uncharacterized protein CLUP02_16958 [Colletotrichum lupini]|uniref:Uncharacterized protein n=1 Tax=Colletotrichum lupini TaxID=145971 RepID=A0A9Q8T8W2_9PEZI|nr:uncharacterized protein CLUP02_16958 [Colletotrichum lupini]UQC91423.1 hypothetical protein CLUP02_16958 [Colletotrichum lupini]
MAYDVQRATGWSGRLQWTNSHARTEARSESLQVFMRERRLCVACCLSQKSAVGSLRRPQDPYIRGMPHKRPSPAARILRNNGALNYQTLHRHLALDTASRRRPRAHNSGAGSSTCDPLLPVINGIFLGGVASPISFSIPAVWDRILGEDFGL